MTNPPPDEPAEGASPDPAAPSPEPAAACEQPTRADQPADSAGAAEPPQPAPAPPPAAPAPAAGTYFGGPPYPPGGQYPPGMPYPAGAPFAAVPRPPRMPWVNPARRGLVAGLAAAAAVVLLGGGIGIGIAIAPSGNHHGPRFERGVDGFPGLRPGQFGRLPNAQFPGRHQQAPAAPSSGSSATPSSSPTR